jgi:hypothetical protein
MFSNSGVERRPYALAFEEGRGELRRPEDVEVVRLLTGADELDGNA